MNKKKAPTKVQAQAMHITRLLRQSMNLKDALTASTSRTAHLEKRVHELTSIIAALETDKDQLLRRIPLYDELQRVFTSDRFKPYGVPPDVWGQGPFLRDGAPPTRSIGARKPRKPK